ncbi:hypothetical protein [Achromobacter ruhlandii]|uniref:hypothetical protein n=1 Tax=Achromobacter ruhlandii TaxID=72557 RepID=UPI0009E9B261|nr:hypothetical protein [Achromobacter ruhlandii]AVC43175.1 hypothetical protein AL520_30880 [Achromobacter xylosoxidans]
MKIRRSDGEVVNVFAIYWTGGRSLCLGFPRSYGGLCVYDLSEVGVVDATLNFELIYCKDGGGIPGVLHWALVKERLLDDLLERDENAYGRFLEILKSEGQLDDDFY